MMTVTQEETPGERREEAMPGLLVPGSWETKELAVPPSTPHTQDN